MTTLTLKAVSDSNTSQLLSSAVPTANPNMRIVPCFPTAQLLNIPTIEINRDFRRRVKKQLSAFRKSLMCQQIFIVANVTRSFNIKLNDGNNICIDTGLKVLDGNTRLETMRQGLIDTPENVLVIVFDIDTATVFKDEYFGVDNVDAAESKTDKIRGAIQALNLNLTSAKAKGGSFATALEKAYPGSDKEEPLTKVNFFRKEIEMLDKCGIFDAVEKELRHQNFWCACLMGAKLYGEPDSQRETFEHALNQLANMTAHDLEPMKRWNGLTMILKQVDNPHGHSNLIPVEHHKSTKAAAINPSVSFYLFALECMMTNKLVDRKSGFRPTKQWFDPEFPNESKYNEVLDAITP